MTDIEDVDIKVLIETETWGYERRFKLEDYNEISDLLWDLGEWIRELEESIRR